MKLYTCGFVYDASDRLLLIRKNKPINQKGFLNGVGGKYEESDKNYLNCMIREWKEETGLESPNNWELFYTERNDFYECAFFKASLPHTNFNLIDGNANDVGEIFEVYSPFDALRRFDLMFNLYWIIPMSRTTNMGIEFDGKL